jgi:hypothetical protein
VQVECRHLQEESSESTNTSNEASGVERVGSTSELGRGGGLGVSTAILLACVTLMSIRIDLPSASGVGRLGGNTSANGNNGVRSRGRSGRLATWAGRLGANWVAGGTGGVGNSDGDGGGADAGLLRLAGLGGHSRAGGSRVGGVRRLGGNRVDGVGRLGLSWDRRLGGSRVRGVRRLGLNWVGRSRGDRVDRVLGSLGGRLGRGRADGVGWVLSSGLGGAHWVAGVLRVAGSRGRSGSWLGGLSVSVLGDSGSKAGESSEGGNGVTHFG